MRLTRERQRYRRALLDFVVIAAVLCGVYYLISGLDLFERLHRFSRSHEDWELDELIVAALLSVVGVYIFGIRRLFDQQREIRVRQQAEQTARRLAEADPLTGLANRRHFAERLTEALRTMAQSEGGLALIMIDIDNLKPLNDVFGHAAGDQVLTDFARRASRLFGSNGLVARVGGDEFAVVLHPLSNDEEAVQLAEQLLALFDHPLETGAGIRVTAGCSIGIAIAPQDGASADALIRRADIALYRAKSRGRRRYFRFAADMDAGEKRRAAIDEDLRGAIDVGSIRPFYQPVIDLRSREVTGFEALARWHHPVLGDIPPGECVAVAEESGLIEKLSTTSPPLRLPRRVGLADDRQTKLQSVARAARRPAQALKTIRILAETGFDPRRLEIEISEAALFGDVAAARDALAAYRQSGIAVALGDFGSGSASISHLRRVPFDRLKIDKSLIDGMTDSKDGLAFVRAVIGLARALNIPVTAEGIERQDIADRLVEEGCGEGQGFAFGKAMAAEEVIEYLDAVGEHDEAFYARVPPDQDGLSKASSWSSRSCVPNSMTQ